MDQLLLPLFKDCMKYVCLASHLVLETKERKTFVKKDLSVVTIYDIAIQIIFTNLLTRYDIDLVSEEENDALYGEVALGVAGGSRGAEGSRNVQEIAAYFARHSIPVATDRHPQSAISTTERVTVVLDPIDGTKGFVGDRVFSIVVSAMHQNRALFSIVASPKEKRVFYRVGGMLGLVEALPSFRSRPKVFCLGDSPSESLGCFNESLLLEIGVSAEGSHSSGLLTQLLSELSKVHGTRVHAIDGQCKYAKVAAGELDLFVRIPRARFEEKVWDHCAGIDLVHGSSGIVSDLEGNLLSPSVPTAFGVVAALSGTLHQLCLSILQRLAS
ncbi:hypothetical protein NEDG_00789 [Nematocida displodere]|uniref:3'(2'), 5'-bisphosphate nucleotidase n=1 Tax=Nematocida displodere TaxID=1805483 RepID=A0A177ED51_9MICR|nr:hypothetical protein NEDG_00789 [Nematocida displodere]